MQVKVILRQGIVFGRQSSNMPLLSFRSLSTGDGTTCITIRARRRLCFGDSCGYLWQHNPHCRFFTAGTRALRLEDTQSPTDTHVSGPSLEGKTFLPDFPSSYCPSASSSVDVAKETQGSTNAAVALKHQEEKKKFMTGVVRKPDNSRPKTPRSCSPSSFSMTSAQQFVRHHTKLLRSIAASPKDRFAKKKRRIGGVLQKLEREAPQWLLVRSESSSASDGCPSSMMAYDYAELLAALAETRRYFSLLSSDRDVGPGRRPISAAGREGAVSTSEAPSTLPVYDDEIQDDAASDLVNTGEEDGDFYGGLSLSLHRLLSLCLRTASSTPLKQSEILSLLSSAVDLGLHSEAVDQLCRKAISTECLHDRTPPRELATTLRLLSLAVKRCQVVPPSLFTLFSHISAASQIENRDVLQILSSLVRLQSAFDIDVARSVSRRGVDHVAHYTTRDVVFALTAIAYLPQMDERYTTEVLCRCAQLCPGLNAASLGDVSKYVALLHPGRKRNTVAHFCEPEIRRVVYAIADRSQQLLFQFRLRDAKYVLRCLKQHNVKHSLVFSSLVPSTSCA